jgi:hypothetical protein
MLDFGEAKLIPGETYTLCEIGIPVGWMGEWMVDTDSDGTPETVIPFVPGVDDDPVGPGGYSRVFDPNYVPLPDTYTNDTRCVNFVVGVGETLSFQIDNRSPGGEPRTIGYWKNWNTCSRGHQAETAAKNGGPAAGWYLLDDLLADPGYTIGYLVLDDGDCEQAVDILDKRDLHGKKKASDGAYNLAAQLLAAELNLSAGAESCPAVISAIDDAQNLLLTLNFDGTGSYLSPKDKGARAVRDYALYLAGILDQYNNGMLCSP